MSRRNRHRQPAVKARQSYGGAPAPGLKPTASYTADQVLALISQGQQIAGRAVPMPVPPEWALAPFGPGNRLPPAPINTVHTDTGRAEPRLFEYPVSTNLQIEDRRHIPWRILQEAADIPLLRKCIQRRKSVCDLDFTVGVDPKAVAREAAISGQPKTDVEASLRDKYMSEIARVSDWLEVPDRKNGYDWAMWTSLLMENRLVFDATVVYPRRTYGGDLFALEVIDGKTIKPLLDEYGGRPLPPFPAYQQIMYGFPRGEFTADADLGPDGKPALGGDGHPKASGMAADELMYERTILRPHSPYGMPAVEIALLDSMVWMRRMGWIMAEYTEGTVPTTVLESDGATPYTVPQWEAWLIALNDQLGGSTAQRQKFRLMPPGMKVVQTAEVAERYKPEYDKFLIQLVAGDFGLPASEIGFTDTGALGASFHEGEEDILNRQTRRPDSQWLSKLATRLAVRQLGMPPVLSVQILGLESEDEAAADAVADAQLRSGRTTLNIDNARRGLPPYSFPEADMPMIIGQRGVVFLEGASQTAPPGMLISPGQAPQVGPDGQPLPPGQQPGQQDGGPDTGQDKAGADSKSPQASKPGQKDKPPAAKPAAKSVPERDAVAELAAFRRWNGRGTRPFQCHSLTKADALALAPELLNNSRILFAKAAEPDPKVPARRGLAGTGTRS